MQENLSATKSSGSKKNQLGNSVQCDVETINQFFLIIEGKKNKYWGNRK